jgi:hypothetical protein
MKVVPREVEGRAQSTTKMKHSSALEPGAAAEEALDGRKCLPEDLVAFAGICGANQPVHTTAKVFNVTLSTEIVW